LMVGMGETYLAAYALAVGYGEIFSGLVTVIPILAGALIQGASTYLYRFVSSQQRWVIASALVQALSLFILASIAYFNIEGIWLLFAVTSLFWAAGMSAGPPWNSLMGSVVPAKVRIHFFTLRNRYCQIY